MSVPETALPATAVSPAVPARMALWLSALVLLLLYGGTGADMVRIWWNASTFNHCFLIAPISAWLIWQRREELARIETRGSMKGVAWLLGNGLLWSVGALSDVALAQHLAMVGFVIGLAWALLGDEVFRLLRFPLFYLYFAVPFGEFLVPHLQQLTAHVSVFLLRLTGLPVFLDDLYISIPGSRFVVAEACSGINYLIATLAVGTVFAYLSYRSWRRRAVFMLLVLLVPLLANGMRAALIVLISHYSGHRLAAGVDHFIYGWVFFGIVIALLFWIGSRFSDVSGEAPRISTPVRSTGTLPLSLLLLTLLALASGRVIATAADIGIAVPAAITVPSAPGWNGPVPVDSPFQAQYPGARQVVTVEYRFGEVPVLLSLAYYPAQGQGAEAVSSVNFHYQWKRCKPLRRDTRRASLGGDEVTVDEAFLGQAPAGWLMWSWYDVRGGLTADPVAAKLHELLGRLTRRPLGSATIAIATPLSGDPAADRALLQHFLDDLDPRLARLTPGND